MEIQRDYNPQTVESVAGLYAKVFAGPPWNEATKCQKSGRFFGLETGVGQLCPEDNCQGILEEAYPLTETIQYISTNLNKSGAQLRVIKTLDEVVAFAWGYQIQNAQKLAEERYQSAEMRQLVAAILVKNNARDALFYIAEVGVRNDYRGKGLSNLLTAELLTEAKKAQLPTVMRTNRESPMVAVAKRFGLVQVLGPEVTVASRQIFVTGSVVNTLDQENNSRVLFVGNRA